MRLPEFTGIRFDTGVRTDPDLGTLVEYRLTIEPKLVEQATQSRRERAIDGLQRRLDRAVQALQAGITTHAAPLPATNGARQVQVSAHVPQEVGENDRVRVSDRMVTMLQTHACLEYRMIKQNCGMPWHQSDDPSADPAWPDVEDIPQDAELLFNDEGRWFVIDTLPVLGGPGLFDTTAEVAGDESVVRVDLTPAGRRAWRGATRAQADRWVAAVLDGKVVADLGVGDDGDGIVLRGFRNEEDAGDTAHAIETGPLPRGIRLAWARTSAPH
ncbi:MAG: hypothetical protein ABGY41_12325 [Candidatus Poribacteria bacterium]